MVTNPNFDIICEVSGCERKTDSYLCKYHRQMAEDTKNVIVTCDKCNSILDVRPKDVPENRNLVCKNCERLKELGI